MNDERTAGTTPPVVYAEFRAAQLVGMSTWLHGFANEQTRVALRSNHTRPPTAAANAPTRPISTPSTSRNVSV